MKIHILALCAGAAISAGCTVVPARPVAYYPPAPVYAAPQVVVAAPQPYYQSAPVVVYPRPYVGFSLGFGGRGHHHY
jgi:hypothetical protein